jgi:hypothetical protein
VIGLSNYAVDKENPIFRFIPSTVMDKAPGRNTLFVVLLYFHLVIGYALFGLNVDRPSALDDLWREHSDELHKLI